MPAVGYHAQAEALAIAGVGVFPALTLSAAAVDPDLVQITSIDGRVEFLGNYTFLMRIDGTTFNSQAEAVAYLQEQFSIDPSPNDGAGNATTIVGVDGGVI